MDGNRFDRETSALLVEAGRQGALQVLRGLGLEDEAAGRDVVELRSLLQSWREVKRGALKQLGQVAVWMLLLLILLALGLRNQLTPPAG